MVENLEALERLPEKLLPAEVAAIDAIPHLVAAPRNRPATFDFFGVGAHGGAEL